MIIESVVCRQQLLQRISSKLLAGFLPSLVGMIVIWASLIIVQMVPVYCTTRSNEETDSRNEN